MAYYGRRVPAGTNVEDFGRTGGASAGQTTPQNLRACVFDASAEDGHAYAMGVRIGAWDAGDPVDVTLITYSVPSGNPADQLGRTAAYSVSTVMNDATGGVSTDIDLLASFLIQSGVRYAPAFNVRNGRAGHGMIQAGKISGSNEQFYYRDWTSSTPPDPMGYTSASVEGHLDVWIKYQTNTKPNVPSNVAPANNGTVTTLTPAIEGDFVDPDETLPNGLSSDYLASYQVQVKDDGATTTKWDSGVITASSGERSARRSSIVYAGPALTLGNIYECRIRHRDRLGAWSSYTSWIRFTVAGGGVVTLDGTPTGKQETVPTGYQGRWHHATAVAADRVQIRFRSGGTIFHTSAEITKAVASAAMPGTLFTISDTEAGNPSLVAGGSYQYETRGRATTGSVWSGWSAPRSFTINAVPSIPSNLAPAGGIVLGARPMLVCKATDVDDNVASGLTVETRIKNAAGTVLFTRTMSLRAGTTDTWEYQTTPTDLASYAVYRYDCRAGDGTAWSVYSTEATFEYAAVPAFTVSAPTNGGTVSTALVAFAWSLSSGGPQTKKRARLWEGNDTTGRQVHDSGTIVDATNGLTLPGTLSTGEGLHNGVEYAAQIDVTNGSNLTGSVLITFTLSYTPPATIAGVQASPELMPFDTRASAIRVTWDASTVDPGDFDSYRVLWRPIGAEFETATVKTEISNQAAVAWVDAFPVSGAEGIYSVVQLVTQGLDLTESLPAESVAVIALDGVVIADTKDPALYRVAIKHILDRLERPIAERSYVQTWSPGPPETYDGPGDRNTLRVRCKLLGDAAAAAGAYVEALRIVRRHKTSGEPYVLNYRDERGRFGWYVVDDLSIRDLKGGRYEIDLLLGEVSTPEGFV